MGLIVVVLMVLVTAGCGTARMVSLPQPHFRISGGLAVGTCVEPTSGTITCLDFSGMATNTGPGCAMNVRGVTKTYRDGDRINLDQPVGEAEWRYDFPVLVHETFEYEGDRLLVPIPLQLRWQYFTTITADAIPCK